MTAGDVMFKVLLWGLLAGLLGLCAAAGSAAAADPFILTTETAQFTSSFALRYWYGLGNTSKSLYGFSRDDLVSRLSYTGLQSHSLEIFGRVDHSPTAFEFGAAADDELDDGIVADPTRSSDVSLVRLGINRFGVDAILGENSLR